MDTKNFKLNLIQCLKLIKQSSFEIDSVQIPERSTTNSLVFISSKELLEIALKKSARHFIIQEKIYESVSDLIPSDSNVWTTNKINQAMVEVLALFNHLEKPDQQIHPTAIIDLTVKIGKNVTIDPYVIIKKNSSIANNSWIKAHTTIESNVKIGSNTTISSQVVIGEHCEIGNFCQIASHVTIGSQGFGFYTDNQNKHHHIPQIGKVIIEDHCDIGSHCSIDRATINETRIKSGSKFDNFAHIAHNCTIGENAIIAGGFMVAGSTVIGKNLMTSGGVHVNGHIKIADNVVLTANAGVIHSVEQPGVYGGFPLTPHKESLRIMTSLAFLPQLRKQVSQIMKHLGIEKE